MVQLPATTAAKLVRAEVDTLAGGNERKEY